MRAPLLRLCILLFILGISLGFLARGGPAEAINVAAVNLADDAAVLKQARSWATNGQRSNALELLSARLDRSPADADARLLRGMVLSWEGRYSEARRDLEQVIDEHPAYGDAVMALVNVGIWSGQPEIAEPRTVAFLAQQPNDVNVRIARVRLLRSLKRYHDAFVLAQSILQTEPHNAEARDLRNALRDYEPLWEAGIVQSAITYSNGLDPWHETAISLKRKQPAGTVIFRYSRAQRGSDHSSLAEIDLYPKFRDGTYAYLNVGYSREGNLYPHMRGGAELFQSLGKGFETSAGFRWLNFYSARVTVYTASLGRYHHNWYYSARTFLTPSLAGTSNTVQFQVRRYFGDGLSYAAFTYGRGAAPFEIRSVNQIGVLNSNSISADLYWQINRTSQLVVQAGTAQQKRLFTGGIPAGDVRQLYFDLGIRLRMP